MNVRLRREFWLSHGLGLMAVLLISTAVWGEDSAWSEPVFKYPENQYVSICEGYVRVFSGCGNMRQHSNLLQEIPVLGDYEGARIRRATYFIPPHSGDPKAIAWSGGTSRRLWFQDAEGNIRNINLDFNPAAFTAVLKRSGEIESP